MGSLTEEYLYNKFIYLFNVLLYETIKKKKIINTKYII